MLKLLQPGGARDNRDQARKKRKVVEHADMEPGDRELIRKVRATSLDQSTKMPWFATTKAQWDEDLRLTPADLAKSQRAEALASLYEKPRLPAPSSSSDSSSSSSTSSEALSEVSVTPKVHPEPEVLAGKTEFSWAVHRRTHKLWLHQLKGA